MVGDLVAVSGISRRDVAEGFGIAVIGRQNFVVIADEDGGIVKAVQQAGGIEIVPVGGDQLHRDIPVQEFCQLCPSCLGIASIFIVGIAIGLNKILYKQYLARVFRRKCGVGPRIAQ